MKSVARFIKSVEKNPAVQSAVHVFRNGRTGQIIYSRRGVITQELIKEQFPRPNWQNELPDIRKDLWRPLAILKLGDKATADEAIKALKELKLERSLAKNGDEISEWRKKAYDGNIWHYRHYRPVYVHESVADLATVTDACVETSADGEEPPEIFWTDQWSRGAAELWNPNVKHTTV
ncbi:hypothetical protein CANCADRAFT_15521, partial [Tortispora caseinolytica NRRL Y-17796]